ncbi:MAG: LacI family DNA-binding transcriptional regulator [Anaerolineales bacterium]
MTTKTSGVTIKDVAREAGVSIATVSYVFNETHSVREATKARVLAAAERLGYRPSVLARNLRAQRSRILGYGWYRQRGDRWHPILDRFLYSMAEAAEAHDYHILTFTTPPERKRWTVYDDLVGTGRVDGFILSETNAHDSRIRYLMDKDFPFVAFGRAGEGWDFPYVDIDGEEGIYRATRHLMALGHRRIGFIAWPEGSLTGHYRSLGYLRAYGESGLSPDPAWTVRSVNEEAAGREAAGALLALPAGQRPTALVAVSDLIALGVMNALRAAGLQPGRDVAVVGFDDIPTAQYLHPSLSSVRQPIDRVGELVVTMLLQLIDGQPLKARQVLVEPELIVRESSGGSIG